MKTCHILPLIFVFLSGCAIMPPKPKPVIKETVKEPIIVKPEAPFKLLTHDNIPFFIDKDNKESLLKAAKKNALYLESIKDNERFYMFGARKVNAKLLIASANKFLAILKDSKNETDFNLRIKENFDIYQMAGSDNEGTVTFSSYYEPIIEAGLTKTKKYKYPIYAKPPDLIYANLEDFNPKFKGEKISGRIENGNLIPYYTRNEIDFQNLFEGKNLEIAWFINRIDIMDLHIQGSGKLALPDGKTIKAKFAATNSLPFKGWITHLLDIGVLKREDLNYQKAKQYILEHPEIEKETLSVNKRYTFFELEEIGDPLEGPQGTFGYPIVGMRSIATDASILPLGALAYISLNMPKIDAENKFIGLQSDSRFVFCQDTGGAIKGPGRVDFFAGTGHKAHVFANKLWEKGTLHIFVLKKEKESNKL
ncbi:MAG: MltA domain-containing protein [Elusimicrobia bacterium]|nr:MltA domain-containing protein [Elusimicrobiota bacterium]